MSMLTVRPAIVVALLVVVGAARPARARVALVPLAPLAPLATPVARAAVRAAGHPHLLVSPVTVAPGAALAVAGTGYAAREPVRATLGGRALTTTPAVVATDAQGDFIATVTVPTAAAPGPTLLVVVGARSRTSARLVVDVRPPRVGARRAGPPRHRAARRARRGCALLLPRAAFPPHMAQWASARIAPNAGAAASGLQQAHYRWGYVLVTPDLYPTVAAARRRYQQAARLLHGDRRVRTAAIGQQMVVWVTGDQMTHYTITTILLRARATVAEINVGAGGPVVGVAADLARAVSARACG